MFKKSKIQFKRVFARNFRSVDNMGMEFLFGADNPTVIGSLDNGAGKSTLLVHALYYVLFDKPYGKGNTKTGLINSRSNKDSLVTVEFDANGSSWKITRGQKPTLFEIHKDGVMVDDEASLTEYQKNLSKVLGMDEKVFCNTVALGKDKFVPFVDMSTPDRRNYGEQMLDATVFTAMNDVNKAKIKATQAEQLSINSKLNSLTYQIDGIEKVIAVKKQSAATQVSGLEERYAQATAKARESGATLEVIKAELEGHRKKQTELTEAQGNYTKLYEAIQKVKQNLSEKNRELQRAIAPHNENCTLCGQKIPHENRDALIETLETAIKQVQTTLDAAELKLKQTPNHISVLQELTGDINRCCSGAAMHEYALRTAIDEARTLNAKMADLERNPPDWQAEEAQLNDLLQQKSEAETKLRELDVQMVYHKINEAGLKDDGAKSQIILQYLPFINERINWYLEQMNMFIIVELDAEFELNMIAPDRKNQTIASLSTGQKARIDLATLLAWRDVARMSAACDTNVLILDEVLENMSEAGVSDFLYMWGRSEGSESTSLYVITQRVSEFRQQFDNCFIYGLKDSFTYLVESE